MSPASSCAPPWTSTAASSDARPCPAAVHPPASTLPAAPAVICARHSVLSLCCTDNVTEGTHGAAALTHPAAVPVHPAAPAPGVAVQQRLPHQRRPMTAGSGSWGTQRQHSFSATMSPTPYFPPSLAVPTSLSSVSQCIPTNVSSPCVYPHQRPRSHAASTISAPGPSLSPCQCPQPLDAPAGWSPLNVPTFCHFCMLPPVTCQIRRSR